ncbi:receptor-like protein 43 [Rhodamnia argentea]|uniref:Receptor-like protein 43 n=1 Tax=Rhodamnia argentea TaxID=178133 RepID=A0A8B8NMB6_9MYRT|nr:receptor-like protein 43 [Rhodamnia argentea]
MNEERKRSVETYMGKVVKQDLMTWEVNWRIVCLRMEWRKAISIVERGNSKAIPLRKLETIGIVINLFQGQLPAPPRSRTVFYSAGNRFNGDIPSLICNASSLLMLTLSDNNLTGSIPQCLANLTSLWGNSIFREIPCSVCDLKIVQCMPLSDNFFNGRIPECLGNMSSLSGLGLSNNQLGGPLPPSLVNCTYLTSVGISPNKINDTFPFWMESLPMLEILNQDSKRLQGPLDKFVSEFPFPSLFEINLAHKGLSDHLSTKPFQSASPIPGAWTRFYSLSNNMFAGEISSLICNATMMMVEANQYSPQYIGADLYQDLMTVTMKGSKIVLEKILTTFTTINLSNNKFQMEIPDAIRKLVSLRGLNLSENNITGHIPQLIGNLAKLEWLDLSTNKLSGMIPGELKDLTALSFLNFSGNQLSGPMPQGNQFNTFKNDSFASNSGLCGFPLSQAFDRHENQPPPRSIPEGDFENTTIFDWKIILMGYGCGLIGGLSMGYIVFQTRRPERFVRMFEEKYCKKVKRPRKNPPRFHGR